MTKEQQKAFYKWKAKNKWMFDKLDTIEWRRKNHKQNSHLRICFYVENLHLFPKHGGCP